ncbi:unnamed protein product [Dovyalis caffra]|uniref:Uncharacterized protein n=1 Tax=Dovyalis caffra TaxID=77055 RepID=A0AAV1SLC8_9ROSI|nr:unnamed protein product [Dovyalis caffra]
MEEGSAFHGKDSVLFPMVDNLLGLFMFSQATLGFGISSKNIVVQCNVGNFSPVFLCSSFREKAEISQLHLEFEERVEVVFEVITCFIYRKKFTCFLPDLENQKGSLVAYELQESRNDTDLEFFKHSTISAATNNFSPAGNLDKEALANLDNAL